MYSNTRPIEIDVVIAVKALQPIVPGHETSVTQQSRNTPERPILFVVRAKAVTDLPWSVLPIADLVDQEKQRRKQKVPKI